LGHISVRKIATPSANGTEISNARKDDMSVPKINGHAPKLLLTGSQAERKKKLRPNLESVSCERETSSNAIRKTMPKMLSAHKNTRTLKVPSAMAELPRRRRKVRTTDCSADGFTSDNRETGSDTCIFAGCVKAGSCIFSTTSVESIHP
jgi:hypothetical protein